MFEDFVGWHLELTRKCNLACPACPRTYDFDSMSNPTASLDYDLIKQFFFDKQKIKNLEYMLFCGNLGDPIYHRDFHKISEHFFDVKNLWVNTNGMHKKEFWERVLTTWPKNSKIILGIDGLEDTNHLYRVNSKWQKIQELFDLISTTKRKCEIEWKFIVFEHNYHQIDEAHELSKKLGINYFNIQKTRKLNETTNANGLLKEYQIDKYFKYKKEYEDYLAPFCHTGDLHYINAEGFYSPCCWWPDFDRKQWDGYNISQYTMKDIQTEFYKFSRNNLEGVFNESPKPCQKFCRKVKDSNNDFKIPNTQINRTIIKNA